MVLENVYQKNLAVYSIIGIIFVFIVGTLFHFLFEATGNNRVIGAFVPVNESVWEHIKLLLLPYLIFVLLMWLLLGGCINNFIPGIILGLFAGSLFMVFAFYTYVGALTRENNLNVDIMIFFLAIIISFIVSYTVFISPTFSQEGQTLSLVGLVLYLGIFVLFTYYPIEIPLLQDPISGGYGIPDKS